MAAVSLSAWLLRMLTSVFKSRPLLTSKLRGMTTELNRDLKVSFERHEVLQSIN
jgi:hypothetical protein